MNRNSVRNRPTPSASTPWPGWRRAGVRCWRGSAPPRRRGWRRRGGFEALELGAFQLDRGLAQAVFLEHRSSGSTMTTPRMPSMMMSSSSFDHVADVAEATTAGIDRLRATMAVWPVGPPTSVMKPATA